MSDAYLEEIMGESMLHILRVEIAYTREAAVIRSMDRDHVAYLTSYSLVILLAAKA